MAAPVPILDTISTSSTKSKPELDLDLNHLTTLLATYPQIPTNSLPLALQTLYQAFALAQTLAATFFPRFKSTSTLSKLWQAITLTNQHFRTRLSSIQKYRPVERRKLRSTYLKFLISAQEFLIGLVCILSENAAMPAGVRGMLAGNRRLRGRVMELAVEADGIGNCNGDERRKEGKAVVKVCYDAIVYLGDLSRYREQLRGKDVRMEYALGWMDLAVKILPRQGAAWHQRAMVYIKGEGIENQMQTIYNLHRAASVRLGTADAVTSLRLYLERLRWREQSRDLADSDVHALLKVDHPDWTQWVSADSLFSAPFSKDGFLIDTDGVKHSET